MVGGRRWRDLLRAASIAIAIAGGAARAEGLTVAVEPGYTHSETDVTDQAGTTTHQRADLLAQSYRLSLDRTLTEHLAASAGATLLHQRSWQRSDDASSLGDGRATTLFGRLTLATSVLSAGVGADRREQSALAASSPTFVAESYTGYASWRPIDLPELDLRLSHVSTHDASRLVQDAQTDSAALSARHNGPSHDLRYLLSWNRASDQLHRSSTTAIDQAVIGSRSDSLFAGRTTTYVSGTFQNRNVSTSAEGDGGTVSRQQIPVNGLSAVETFPAIPENVVLTPNPLLVDGNTTATAGVDVGFGAALGERNARDVGARFADAVTAVNTIHVWFDRSLSPEVGAALASGLAVYQSDDNQRWTAVPNAQPPVVSPFENRIEITTAQVQARFLKVVLRPLAPGVTTDVAYRGVFVTEVHFLLVLPAALLPRRQTANSVSANASVRTAILRSPDLAHDLSVSMARRSESALTTYTVVNGLSFARPLSETVAANARAARQDLDAGRGHEGLWQWNAALTGRPYPTAYWSLNYSGAANERTSERESSIGHSLTALGRADWYEGISTQANASASVVSQGPRTGSTVQASGTTSLTPNGVVTVTAGALYSRSVSSAPDTGDVVTNFARVDGSVSLTPAPALSAAGTVSRVLLGARPTTLATLQLNYFPLRGDVQLTMAYSKTIDTAAEATTELFGPTLRWNVRRGVSIKSSYAVVENVAPAQILRSRVFASSLLITL